MRLFFPLVASLVLAACSEAPVETKAKKYADPLPAVTGRMAFQSTYPSARGWAPDALPLTIRSMNLNETKSAPGKSMMWEVVYASVSKAEAKVFTWSAIEDEKLHQGVYPGASQPFSGGQNRTFAPAALKTDTDEALKEAKEASEEYLATPGEKPDNTFMLESTSRFPNPVWRVLWGASAGSAKRQVFVDATTGKVVGKE